MESDRSTWRVFCILRAPLVFPRVIFPLKIAHAAFVFVFVVGLFTVYYFGFFRLMFRENKNTVPLSVMFIY